VGFTGKILGRSKTPEPEPLRQLVAGSPAWFQNRAHPREDNQITVADDDTLGRAAAARAFDQQALALDATEGAGVGMLGPRGPGKTSFINLARMVFNDSGVPAPDFNPSLPKC
jgi:hypothetical protein